MEFITAEQFLKEDKEVQEIFRNWWFKINGLKIAFKIDLEDIIFINGETRKDIYPLLTEGQLRKFIEDKTGCYIDISHNSMDTCIQLCDKEDEYPIEEWEWQYLSNDLLQAYWKVAVEIAKHEIR